MTTLPTTKKSDRFLFQECNAPWRKGYFIPGGLDTDARSEEILISTGCERTRAGSWWLTEEFVALYDQGFFKYGIGDEHRESVLRYVGPGAK